MDPSYSIDDGSASALLLMSLPDAALVVDASGEVQWGNRAAEDLFGQSLEESRGASSVDFVHPDDLELVLRSLESVQSKARGSLIEIRVRTSSGWRLVELVGTVVDWPEEGGVLLTLRDLTDRRRFELATDRASQSLTLVQNSPTLTMLIGSDGVVQSASGALTRSLGHDPEWVTGRPLEEFVAEDDRPLLALALESAMLGAPSSNPVTTTVSMVRHDGQGSVPFELAFVNLLDDPTIGGFIVSGHDVSLRLQAEREQRKSLSLVTATLDATADGILVMDNSGYFTSFNRQFTRMWRFPQSVMEKRNVESAITFIHDQMSNSDAVVQRLIDIVTNDGDDSYDILDFKDGRVFEARSKLQRVDNEVVGRVWTFRDMTDRKRLEERLSYQAFHDSLTGLGNRVLFQDRMEHAADRLDRSGGTFSVMFLDMDRFKPVNDVLGHPAGDQLPEPPRRDCGTAFAAATPRPVSEGMSSGSSWKMWGSETR